MSPAAVIADVDRTVAVWRAEGVTARMAWFAMTGNRVHLRSWQRARLLMVRIALGRQPTRPTRPHPKHKRLRHTAARHSAPAVRRHIPRETADPWAGMGECFA